MAEVECRDETKSNNSMTTLPHGILFSIKLRLFGDAKIDDDSGLKYYIFRCEQRGLVKDYLRGV